MGKDELGRILAGDATVIARAYESWRRQPVDEERLEPGAGYDANETTLAGPVSVTGPGTFKGGAQRTLHFEPTDESGWWFDRTDLSYNLPILVSARNVWTTNRNIVLRSGSPHNYMRMVEHIVALKVGLGLDNVRIRMDAGDPPLFERGSLDLVEAVERAGRVTQSRPAVYWTVKEPVTLGSENGGFLTFQPAEGGARRLEVDCAVDFRSAIGQQRIRFVLSPETFRRGAEARTNTTRGVMLYTKTVGKIFADVRNLGYTTRNILVAGPRRYVNEPRLVHNGKSLEAAWHRAALDLLAAVALIENGRFAGRILSYKAGHTVDTQMIIELYRLGLLRRL